MKRLSKAVYPVAEYPETILQIGEGNFMRGFINWHIQKLNDCTDFKGRAVVVPPRKGSVTALNEQDGLYTLCIQGFHDQKEMNERIVIQSISRGISTYTDYEAFLHVAESPDLRFVFSNTTEAGLVLRKEDRLEDRPQVSFPGKLTAFLYHRFKAFAGDENKGLIILPCELIEQNGDRLKEYVTAMAAEWDLPPDFVTWLKKANTFCNTLVDRIVPGFSKEAAEAVQKEDGYIDELLVTAEYYHLFVIEAPAFVQKELPFQEAGLNVLFVEDITPYRMSKVRILNGAHTAMVPIAYSCGLDTVKKAVDDELVGSFIRSMLEEEVLPGLPLPEDELLLYTQSVWDRFCNPFVKHQLLDIALNGVSKFRARILPSLLDYVALKKQLPMKLVFSLSSLIYFYQVNSDKVKDDETVMAIMKEAREEMNHSYESMAHHILSSEAIWGMDLTSIEGLNDAVAKQLTFIHENGMRAAVDRMLHHQYESQGEKA
ncbi:altronate oxidoreductase [Bacillus xiamenensis]|uniref:Tagaturonate reductase n=1 Tax=Bacillus xiamenensis TaxID=1178537 RepID=A0ABT4EXF7_9BACI|nr:tagaturonate reductase [Bacillus xiamenensis]MBG9911944.1 altronate oxidoreductase [Bacillus xiamenensis]MCY9574486.1 tagaturonate reductase [Bacillus xiamenensis]